MKKMLDRRKFYLLGNKEELDDLKKNQILIKIKEYLENLKELENLNIQEVKIKYGYILEIIKSIKLGIIDKKYLDLVKEKLIYFRQNYYNLKSVEKSNWWQWEIGIPNLLNDIFVLLDDNENFVLEKKLNLETSKYFQPDPRYSGNNPVAIHPSNNPFRISTGGNRIDTVKISVIRSMLSNDESELVLALKSIEDVLKIKESLDEEKERDGFYNDGTFLQHSCVAYNGTYGYVLLNGIAEIVYLLDEKYLKYIDVEKIKNIIFKFFEPFFFRARFTDVLNGRSITRKDSNEKVVAHLILNSVMLLNERLKDDNLEKFLKRELSYIKEEYFNNEIKLFYLEIAKKYIDFNGIEYKRSENLLINSDRIYIRDKNYSIAISGHSMNISNYESINGENENGHYTGDGMIIISNKNTDYVNYWNYANLKYIPGTTEIFEDLSGKNTSKNFEKNNMDDDNKVRISKENGKVKFDMDFVNHNKKLKSKKNIVIEKNVLIYEEEIESEEDFYTCIENRKYLNKPKIIINSKEIEYNIGIKNIYTSSKVEIEDMIYEILSENNLNILVDKIEDRYYLCMYLTYENNKKCKYKIEIKEGA